MKKLLRLSAAPDYEPEWQTDARNDLRVAQSVALVRHLPMVMLGNALGMSFGALALADRVDWQGLVLMLLGMAYLLAPVALSWSRLRRRARPKTVSVRHLRRQTLYSGVLGCFWAANMLYYLPGSDFVVFSILTLGACFLALGASATLYVLPSAALAYAGPVLCAALYNTGSSPTHDGHVLSAAVFLMGCATLWILRSNWINFREVVRLIQEKSRLLQKAESVRLAEEEFVENLNHEMRNALTSIIGYFDVAADPELSFQEHAELIEHARETGGLLQVLLSDLLDVGRLNAGRTRLTLAPFAFRHLVRTSVISASGAINGQDIQVRTNIDSSVPEVLVGDASRLQQILLNLIGNAIKVMDRGTVVVQARYRGNLKPLLEITVSDDGPGITKTRQRTLFHRFSQVSDVPSSTGPTVGGWGLGLSICAALVELMRGDIRVVSEPGRGAAFTIRLPLHEDRRRLPRDQPSQPAAKPPQEVNFFALEVLVVDDTAANRLILRKMLQALGCKVEVAADGPEALRLCSERRFNLVFMDLELGEMDGLTTTRLIRALPDGAGSMAIVAVTGFASMERVSAIHDVGMNDHVLKPVRLDNVASVLKKWAR